MNTAAPMRNRVLAQVHFETATLLRNGEQLLVAIVLPAMVLVGLALGWHSQWMGLFAGALLALGALGRSSLSPCFWPAPCTPRACSH